MVDIIQPLDFLGRMGGPANLPNLIGDASAITAQRDQQAATIDALRSRALFEQSQAAQQIEQQQRAQAYQQALRGHLESPTAGSAANLSLQFPEYSKQINDAYALQDGAKRDGELRLKSTIYSRAHAGDWGAAGTELERYIKAAKDAGEDVSDEEAMLAHLNSGDPSRQKMAIGILGYDLATIVGPDKWADFHGNKVVGNALVGNTGDVKYEAPEKATKPQYMNVDGTVIELGGKDGGNTFEQAHNFVAGVEGGYAARDGRSGAPVNYGVNQGANPDIDVKSLTPETAKQILHDRYFVPSGAAEIADPALATVVYDTAVNMGPGMAKAMLKASGGDVEKFLDAREKRYRAIGGPDLPGWLNRNAKLREAVGGMGGGPKVVYQGPSSAGKSVKKDVIAMRKEFDALSEVKAYKEIAPVLMSARRAPDTPAGDIQLAYTVGKILDPNSVVREGELALAIKAGSPLERLLGQGTYVSGQGARMTPEIRRQLLEMVNERALAVRQQYDAARANYEGYARDMGVAPASIIGQHVANAYVPKGGKPAASGGWSIVKEGGN